VNTFRGRQNRGFARSIVKLGEALRFHVLKRWLLLAASAAWFLLCGSAQRAVAAPAPVNELIWHTNVNRVDARISAWNLATLLEQIGTDTGWEIFVETNTHHTVSAKFQNLPVGEAMKRLLGDVNYALLPQTNGPAKLFVFQTSIHEATQLIKPAPRRGKGAAAKNLIPNELIVRLKPGSKEKIDDLARRLGAKVVGRSDALSAYRLQFTDEASANAARGILQSDSEVSSVDSNYSMNQPTLTQPLAMSSMPALNLKPNTATDPHRLVVGLIDTSVQAQSSGIKDFLLPGISVAGEAQANDTSPTHGTSMAETILRGVSVAPQGADGTTSTRILPVDVYGASPDTTTFDVANGIYAAVKNGATVINMSLGSTGDSPFLHEVIQEAHQQGVMFVAAAGNEPTTAPTYPAAYSEVLSATAADKNGNLAPYANRGSFVDVAAPGGNVIYFNNQAYLVTGTSTSSAYVSGLAAGLATSSGQSLTDVQAEIMKSLAVKKPANP
jgi:hypothetical protein